MARSTRSKAAAPAPAAPVAVMEEEEPAEEVGEEATEVAVPNILDLSPIQPAIDAAHAGKDPTTGEVSLTLLNDVRTGYQDLTPKSKASIRASSKEAIKNSMLVNDVPTARAWLDIQNSLVSSKRAASESVTPKTPSNPTPVYVQAVASIRLAYAVLLSELRPSKLDDDVDDQIEARVADLSADMTEFISGPVEGKEYAPEILKAARFSRTKPPKSGGGGSGPRGPSHNLGNHILEALGTQVGKFMSISDIQGYHSAEYNGEKPSGGAILNRLFPTSGKPCTLPNVTVSIKEGKKGATLNA
jgi:hypothetical protein